MYILDHEYAGLNLLGSDIGNYCFNCSHQNIKSFNFEKFYDVYIRYINSIKSSNFVLSYFNEKRIDEILNKKYFINSMKRAFMFYCYGCLNFLNEDDNNKNKLFLSFANYLLDIYELIDKIKLD